MYWQRESNISFVKKYYFLNIKILVLSFLILLVFITQAQAEPPKLNDPNDMFSMSIEELMEVQVVVSASRQGQKISKVPVPISVITAEDIQYSGLKTIPEILQFACGVDVRRIDRQRYAVGVRGLFGLFSDRTLILIDGRPVTDPIHGTTHWEKLPIMVEDIERIEIVRGPGGAAWGANAYTGVINIITKDIENTLGVFSSTTITEFGDSYTHLRYGEKKDKWNWRISVGYEDIEDSDSAGAGKYYPTKYPATGFSTYTTRDWGRLWKFDSKAEYKENDDSLWSFGASHSSSQQGDFEFNGYFPRKDVLTEYTRLFARKDYQFDEDTSGYVQWFGNFWNNHCRSITDHMRYTQNDIEGQLNFKPAEKHNMSIGGNARWNRIQTDNYSLIGENILGDDNEYWGGFFVMDSWSLTDRLTIEGQGRIDHFSESALDWSTRLTALYSLDEKKDQTLRVSFARAFRSPSLILRDLYFTSFGNITIFTPTEDVENEKTYSLEAGYSSRLSEHMQFNVDGYYQRFEKLFGVSLTDDPPPPPLYYATFKNIDGANAYGGELSLTYHNSKGKLTAWYAYNGFETDHTGQSTRSFPPAEHKAGITGRIFLNKKWTANASYAYQNGVQYRSGILGGLHTFNRVDLSLSRKFAKDKGEFMFGVADVLNETTDPVFEQGHFTGHETPGRMFFASLQMKF